MKKFTSSDLGGAPVNKNDLRDIFNSEIWDAVQALLSQFNADTQGIVVSGCVTTANASNFDMTAGIVYLNGEFMRIAAATNQTFTKYIAPATTVNDTRTFADITSHVVAVTKGAELVGSAPGSGQYLTISSLTDLDDRRWNPATQAQITTLQNNNTAISGGTWQSVALSASDIENSSNVNPTSIGTSAVEYRIGEKEVFVFIKLTDVIFAATPTTIIVRIPSPIRAYINTQLGDDLQAVTGRARPNSTTVGVDPTEISIIGVWDNTEFAMRFKAASLIADDFVDVRTNFLSCQFFVKV